MKNGPAFQLYAADFYMDTVGWSCEEVGLYFRLLMAEWVNGPLPNDTRRLAKTCQMSLKKFEHNFNKILPKFIEVNSETLDDNLNYLLPFLILKGKGYLINLRLEETRKKQLKYSESRKESANHRWKRDDAHAFCTQCVGDALHSSSSFNIHNTHLLTSVTNKVINPPIPPLTPSPGGEGAFQKFWDAYPKKKAKPGAMRAFSKICPDEKLLELMLLKIAQARESDEWVRERGRYIPYPATWLNARRWEDGDPEEHPLTGIVSDKTVRTVKLLEDWRPPQ